MDRCKSQSEAVIAILTVRQGLHPWSQEEEGEESPWRTSR